MSDAALAIKALHIVSVKFKEDKLKEGTIECPACHKTMNYFTNGHSYVLKCTTPDCLALMT